MGVSINGGTPSSHPFIDGFFHRTRVYGGYNYTQLWVSIVMEVPKNGWMVDFMEDPKQQWDDDWGYPHVLETSKS